MKDDLEMRPGGGTGCKGTCVRQLERAPRKFYARFNKLI